MNKTLIGLVLFIGLFVFLAGCNEIESKLDKTCTFDSDCMNYISNNNCSSYCANSNKENSKIIEQSPITCDSTNWNPEKESNCKCIESNCTSQTDCCASAQKLINQNANPQKINYLIRKCNCKKLNLEKYDCSKIPPIEENYPNATHDCATYFTGARYDKEKSCIATDGSGCINPLPFNSIEECEMFCGNPETKECNPEESYEEKPDCKCPDGTFLTDIGLYPMICDEVTGACREEGTPKYRCLPHPSLECKTIKTEISELVEEMNSCVEDDECVYSSFDCPWADSIISSKRVSKTEIKAVGDKIREYQNKCGLTECELRPRQELECNAGKCIAVPPATPECEIGKEYKNTAIAPIECDCPEGFEFEEVEIGWGPCPKEGMSDCPATTLKCVETKSPITIKTNKEEYEQGETVNALLEVNGVDYFFDATLGRDTMDGNPRILIERKNEKEWKGVSKSCVVPCMTVNCDTGIESPCPSFGPPNCKKVEEHEWNWDQNECQIITQTTEGNTIEKCEFVEWINAKPGTYRLKTMVFPKQESEEYCTGEPIIIYSNEFEIIENNELKANCCNECIEYANNTLAMDDVYKKKCSELKDYAEHEGETEISEECEAFFEENQLTVNECVGEKRCVKEGIGIMTISTGPLPGGYLRDCCEGLTLIETSYDEQCNFILPAPGANHGVCSNCGNGTCEEWESKCNCPADCKGVIE